MGLEQIKELLIAQGASRIVVKCLANNDNTKQQVYLGGSFEVLQLLPSGEIYSGGISKKGPIFKAPLDFWWLTDEGDICNAPGSQLILYPKYPEVRFSGFLQKCAQSPRHLMQPPTPEERAARLDKNRVLFLGISGKKIIGYVTHWDDPVSAQVKEFIEQGQLTTVASVFYALYKKTADSKEVLIGKLNDIYQQGLIPSQRIKNGEIVPYVAQNGAGFTLESLFGISPNGIAEPDFEDWELKAHSGRVVTLMTPEPNGGEYTESLEQFLRKYGWSNKPDRMDFASIHKNNLRNEKTNLCLIMQGYDPEKQEIIDPEGGLHLIDPEGNIAAGWGFSKLLEHWKKKHSRTCFVSYSKHDEDGIYFRFGPKLRLAEGADIKRYLNSLYNQAIYYDPGINMKLINDKWKPKKRNQFRIKWKDIESLYERVTDIALDAQDE
ncbi:MvaI/BcnI family restriction endonuclease [Pseudoalteromonas lipolytica]|uniref:MvaI/BcnI family restriction endonuclease n=1 Tax=Pseudoalteromonas lipolytica TaxID=570156 RepID=UPI00309E37E6